jgi:hypothetical protein
VLQEPGLLAADVGLVIARKSGSANLGCRSSKVMATSFSFDGYTFPWDSQPEGWGGAGEFNYVEKTVIHTPINSNIDIITSFGFKSGRRTIVGRCCQAMRDAIRAKFLARTVGYLVDSEGTSVLARIEACEFKELFPNGRYEFSITFVKRQ